MQFDEIFICFVACQQANAINMRCFAHCLNLAVQKGLSLPEVTKVLKDVRRIVTYFHKSPLAEGVLKDKQKQAAVPEHKLIMDVSTRYHSHFISVL